jgi:hypothetical protein
MQADTAMRDEIAGTGEDRSGIPKT